MFGIFGEERVGVEEMKAGGDWIRRVEKFIITRCPCKMVGGRVASSVFSSSFHQVSRKINNAPGSRDKSERKLRLKETTGFEFSFQATTTHSFNINWTILTTLQREGCCFFFFIKSWQSWQSDICLYLMYGINQLKIAIFICY